MEDKLETRPEQAPPPPAAPAPGFPVAGAVEAGESQADSPSSHAVVAPAAPAPGRIVLRDAKGRYVKGYTGNPGGRPKGLAEIRRALARYEPALVEELRRLALEGRSERVRYQAVALALAYLWGPPSQKLVLEGELRATRTDMGTALVEEIVRRYPGVIDVIFDMSRRPASRAPEGVLPTSDATEEVGA